MNKMSSVSVYLKSSIVTFLASFATSVLPIIGNIEWEKSAIIALIVVGVRAGVKALLEYLAIMKV